MMEEIKKIIENKIALNKTFSEEQVPDGCNEDFSNGYFAGEKDLLRELAKLVDINFNKIESIPERRKKRLEKLKQTLFYKS